MVEAYPAEGEDMRSERGPSSCPVKISGVGTAADVVKLDARAHGVKSAFKSVKEFASAAEAQAALVREGGS